MTRLAWLLSGIAILCAAGCQPMTDERAPPPATADAALHRFFTALRDGDYEIARALISTTDLPEADRDAFIEGSRHIRLESHTVTQRHEFPGGAVRFTVKLVFVPEGETEVRERSQEILARRDYRRIWRLKI